MGYAARALTGSRLIPVALVTLLALVGSAASAQASSIVYVKRGDIWLAKPNGRGQRAITKNGSPGNPYRSPAYSDKGVITRRARPPRHLLLQPARQATAPAP